MGQIKLEPGPRPFHMEVLPGMPLTNFSGSTPRRRRRRKKKTYPYPYLRNANVS